MSITAGQLPTFTSPVRSPGVRLGNSTPGVRLRTGTHVAWGRVAVFLTIIALSALLGAGFRAATAAEPVRSDDGAAVAGQTALVEHVVQPGDTLWAIAQRVDPAADPRPMVDRIMRLNGLQGAEVEVGRVLLLPSTP
jgi:nucleoid-associated protein YgaU